MKTKKNKKNLNEEQVIKDSSDEKIINEENHDVEEIKDENVKIVEEEKEPTIEEKLIELTIEKDSFKEKWLRKAAEFENFRNRNIKEKQDWIKNANQRIILEVCDVMDDFERALNSEGKKHQLKDFRKGIDMIFEKLVNITKKEGVEKIDAMGKKFDPNFHEALAQIPSNEKQDSVAAVIRNGYMMNKKVLRPAQVAVSNGEKLEKKSKKDKK